MLLWSCGKYLQTGLKSAKRYRLSCFCVEGVVVADSLWSFFAAVSSQRDVKQRRAEPPSARAVCPWWALLPSFVVMLQGLCCRAKRNLLALPTWIGSSGFFCVLLTASCTKQSGGAEGDGPSLGAKVAVCKTQEVFKHQSLSTPTLSNEAQRLLL